MKVSRLITTLSLAALLSSSAFSANSQPMASGRWEVTTTAEFTSIPVTPTPKYDGLCLDDNAIRSGIIPVRIAVGCKITGGKWEGEKLGLHVTCEDAPPDTVVPAEITAVEGKTFTGFVTLGQMVTYRYTGKWVSSECK